VRSIAANNGAEREVSRYDKHLGRAERAGLVKGAGFGTAMGVMWFGILAAYAVGLWYGGQLIIRSRDEAWANPVTGATVISCFFAIIIGR